MKRGTQPQPRLDTIELGHRDSSERMGPRSMAHRILIVDRARESHEAIRGALTATRSVEVEPARLRFEIDSVTSGDAGVDWIRRGTDRDRPYAVAIVDMSENSDGADTIRRIWLADPHVQVIALTREERPWAALVKDVGSTEQLLLLRRPYDSVELVQMTHAMCQAWVLARETRRQVSHLQDIANDTNRRMAAIVQCSSDAIIMVDTDGRVLHWNAAAERMFGFDADEIVGRSGAVMIPPEHAQEYDRIVQRVLRGEEVAPFETTRLTKSGKRVTVSIAHSPIPDSSGKVTSLAGIVRDISEHKRLEAQARHGQKMEAVGQLAGGVAHDFNNLLMAITGYAQMALTTPDIDEEMKEDLGEILRAADRATDLTRRLLTFSRRQVVQPRVMRVDDLVLRVDAMLRRLIREDTELITLPPGNASVLIDPGEFEQMIVNLAMNSVDAMPEGGKLTIDTADITLDVPYRHNGQELNPGEYVRIRVTDTGIGMNAETRARIFEPFYTTKDPGKGTGLGLSIVYGIVEQAHGHVCVDSEPGRGTTFEIWLPCPSELVEHDEPVQPEATRSVGSETVLLVEDESSVRDVAARILGHLGYRVLEAANGEEALRVAAKHGSDIDLALSDVVMPVMGGPEFVERFTKLYPDTKVLFASGYAGAAGVEHMLSADVAYLQKPFTMHSLAQKVREVLDS